MERAALGAGGLALGSQLWPRAARAAAPIGLPSPQQVRADFQTMVDFGPRLTGSEPHNRYIEWLEREFAAAGCDLLPCDVYETDRWEVGTVALDVLEGSGAGAARTARGGGRPISRSADTTCRRPAPTPSATGLPSSVRPSAKAVSARNGSQRSGPA